MKTKIQFTYSLYTIDDLAPGDHLCCIYETEEEHRSLVTPFLRKGLEIEQRVIYIVDTHTAETILGYLRDDGVDIKSYLERKQLLILTRDNAYMGDGVFDPDGMIDLLRSETEKALADGWAALRVTGEMTWALRGIPGSERLIEYEAKLNNYFPGSKSLAICQYDKRQFSPTVLIDVLHTHPIAVVGTNICDNPFYIPPNQLLSQDLPAVKLNHWLRHLVEDKQAKEAVRASEEKYRDLVENINDVIYTIDNEGIITYVSPAVKSLIGYDPVEFIGQPFKEFVFEEDLPRLKKNLQHAISGQTTPNEYRIPDKIGKIHWIRASSRPQYKGDRVIGIQGVLTDITELKQVEMELLKSMQRLHVVINQVGAVIWAINKDGIFTFSEGKGLEAMGLKPGEVVGQSLFELYADNKQIIDDANRVLKGESFYSFTQIHDITWENRYVPLLDDKGTVIGATGVALDVTDIRKIQQELIESEAKYRHIVENVPTGICTVDLSTFKFLQVNDVMCDILGYTEEELLSMDPVVLFAEEIKKHVLKSISKTKTGEKLATPFEYKIKTKSGQELWTLVNTRIIYKDDKPVSALTIVQDISERKQLEMKLRNAQKMEAISTLAGGIAHEFNNALMILSGSAETLQIRLSEDEHVKKFAKITQNSIQRMVQLADQLLAYARGGNYQSRTIDLPHFIRTALPVIHHNIKPGIRIETDLPRDILNIHGDPTQLQMVMSAVMQNASEAIEKQGRIRVKVRNKEIDEEFAKKYPGFTAGPYVSLAIEDDGKGMTEETKNNIFEPFFTTKIKATGLGMSAVYGIVKNHGGFVYVESEIDKGTIVRIYLPPSDDLAKNAKISKEERFSKSKDTILVVDNEETTRDVTGEILENLGCQVLEANTGHEAVNIAKTHDGPIDLVLLDITTPDMKGKTIYTLLRETRPDLKVVICSGCHLDGAAQEILAAGAHGFLKKPFSMGTLAKKLEEVLFLERL
ncbi:MAG: PAS domain S-box protein [Candidatus Aminicenantes bacterium]|nr:PAS domain S-box protein [Candidatus Aminicenantes bacterium]NIM77203.1 PAS domain S-box protein [Candidatus Aminicenantes bacterium]NIN16497.1 PAS domain S-box protein [Candidatus Aminicenantes bacterium]NIN40357.1 PAS domain S-box protein [Candidatus Aminicenantes bacterium]NIN83177.1 PAS domain S-box protein [Candidatus Aminicenantes bacterium]